MSKLASINLKRWIDEHRHLLKPPVGNATVFKESETIVMIVGGPNARDDFHINESEEFFYQVEGAITLRVFEDGAIHDISIEEGDMFLLPAGVPHSPQRPAGTVGLVIEPARPEGARDALRWYCESCHAVLYEERFVLKDITTQLAPIMMRFRADEALRTCKKCGAVKPPAQLPAADRR